MGDVTTFGAMSEKDPDRYGLLKAAQVTIFHGAFRNTYMNSTDYEGNTSVQETGVAAYPLFGHRSAYLNAYTPPEQGRLFDSTPSTISSAFADKSMLAAVPTLLGLAINKSKQIGTGLQGDSSLSKHSSPLVKRGLKSGILQPNPRNPEGRKNNDYSLARGHHIYPSDAILFKEIEPEQLQAGKQTIRGMLRGGGEPEQPKGRTPKAKPEPTEVPSESMQEWRASAPPQVEGQLRLRGMSRTNITKRASNSPDQNQAKWLNKHYGVPPVHKAATEAWERRNRGEREPDYRYSRNSENETAPGMSDEYHEHMAAQAAKIPAEVPSQSKQEWAAQAVKPARNQKSLF